ncbi:helix-turn-helix domain-containing protein [Uniformispora flossi]|uniref:helix-turn-helix domain-containing protein n=1 Tax=Uniformispora flossi TaxID=3390723 RepID=UPI003C2E434E
MPGSKDLDPYVSARAFYGAELRRLREEARLSQDGLGEQAFCSGAYIGQFEAAVRRPQPELSKIFDFVLGSGEHLQRLCRLARESTHPDYFADTADLEPLAATINEYSPMLLPGMLQTESYARQLTRIGRPLATDAEIEDVVRARIDRAQRLLSTPSPQVWEIVHESALRIVVGSPKIMREQLRSLATAIRSHRLIVQVHPYTAGPHPFMHSLCSLMTFADAPPLVYVEGAHSGQLIDEPALVARYQASYDVARAASLSFSESLAMIESIAEDYAIHDPST